MDALGGPRILSGRGATKISQLQAWRAVGGAGGLSYGPFAPRVGE